MKLILILFISVLLFACTSSSRYSQYYDTAPVRPPTNMEMRDAQVTDEPIGRGNNPYKIKGIRYVPHKQRTDFEQVGTASWYGQKFHGHLTSNGEIYDMFGMTAAHKTLPLPSFVKVTNLANNKSTIVRVNDRGPFHQDRIIDLSYSAAYKLGVYDTGTSKVKIEVLNGETLIPPFHYQIKLTGFNSLEDAEESGKGLSLMLNNQAKTTKIQQQYALIFGPYQDKDFTSSLLEKIKQFGFQQAELEQVP